MSKEAKGKTIRLTPGRKLVEELLHHARKAPTLPLSRLCLLPDVVDARAALAKAPSWTAIFMKAYALVAAAIPELRRAYLPYPYRRLYEHPHSTCAILVEREWQGEPTVLGAKILAPENATLRQIDDHLRHFREEEVRKISPFRQLLRLGRLPGFLRRFVFWSSLYFSGAKRAKRFGTFMMSSLGTYGVEQGHPLTPLTTYFSFGPISPEGAVTLKIIYDHRVMDGRAIARALVQLEETLNTAILDELRTLSVNDQMPQDAPHERPASTKNKPRAA
ncbi:MAG: hypothetical protein U0793_31720 [Gemmataceae bacterium]